MKLLSFHAVHIFRPPKGASGGKSPRRIALSMLRIDIPRMLARRCLVIRVFGCILPSSVIVSGHRFEYLPLAFGRGLTSFAKLVVSDLRISTTNSFHQSDQQNYRSLWSYASAKNQCHIHQPSPNLSSISSSIFKHGACPIRQKCKTRNDQCQELIVYQ